MYPSEPGTSCYTLGDGLLYPGTVMYPGPPAVTVADWCTRDLLLYPRGTLMYPGPPAVPLADCCSTVNLLLYPPGRLITSDLLLYPGRIAVPLVYRLLYPWWVSAAVDSKKVGGARV